MGMFDGVPGLDEYNRRVQMNDRQSDGNMAKIGRAMQLSDLLQKSQAQQAGREQLAQFRATLPPALQNAPDFVIEAYAKKAFAPQEEYTLAPGAARYRGSEKLAESPREVKPPVIKDFITGDKVSQRQFNAETNQWDEVGTGPRFARQVAPVVNVGGSEAQRGQIIFDSKGNAFNVNPYTNEVKPVAMNGQQIQGAQYSPSLQGNLSGAKAQGKEAGQAMGEAEVKLQDMQSMMPRFDTLTQELSALGKRATYTVAGQAADAARRQLGMSVGDAAIARKEYITKVDNEILPLLRQTFGAAFTVKEGESLKATLGDPDASPAEKDAVLRSFIQSKKEQVESLSRRTGQPADAPPPDSGKHKRIANDAEYNALPRGAIYITPDGKTRVKQ